MARLIQYLTVLGLGVQTGTIIFYSFVLTPLYFGHLPREEAGRAVRLGFPGYYFTGIAALTVSLSAALAGGSPWQLALLLAGALGLELYAGVVLLPKLAQLRKSFLDPEAPAADDPVHEEWRALHRLSVQLNLGALGLGLGALWLALG